MAVVDAAKSVNMNSLVGSLISLITKSEIRYEGYMCQLDDEDTTIGIQNVKSFGTEGRRKDGSQVPPSDRIYEYIYFRRSDIKDMEVRSLTPMQTTTLSDNPAIVQSQFPSPPYAPGSLSTSGVALVPNTGYNAQSGVLVPSFGRNYISPQTVANPGARGSSVPHLPVYISRPAMPIAWKCFPGSSGEVSQFHQKQFPQLPQGLMEAHPFQKHTNSSYINAHLDTILPYTGEPQNRFPPLPQGLMEAHPFQKHTNSSYINAHLDTILPYTGEPQNRLIQPTPNGFPPVPPSPIVFGSLNCLSSVPPSSATGSENRFLPMYSQSVTNSNLGKTSFTTLPNPESNITTLRPTMPVDLTSQVSSPLITSNIDTVTTQVSKTGTSVPNLDSHHSKLFPPENPSIGTKNCSPGKLPEQSSGQPLQQAHIELPSSQSLLNANDAPKVNHMSYSEALLSESGNVEKPPQETVKPLARTPRTSNGSILGPYPKDRNLAREDGASHTVQRFTEDFDFEAMYKKFNKEEVWALFDKSTMSGTHVGNGEDTNESDTQEDSVGRLILLDKPVYSKDDFFDALSWNTSDYQSEGVENLAEQRRIDNETFGEVDNNQERHDIEEAMRSGGSQDSNRGRGYANTGRGRVRTFWSRIN